MTTDEQEAKGQAPTTNAHIGVPHTERVVTFRMECENREWLLKNAPRPDYTTDRAALKDLMRSINSYNLYKLGEPILADWLSSFGHEFFLWTTCHTSGPYAYLPFPGITVPSGADLDDLAKRVEALVEVIKPDADPDAGPVHFKIGGYPQDQFRYLRGPDDQNHEEWSVIHGAVEHGVRTDHHGDLPSCLAFIQRFLPHRENGNH